MKVKVGDLVKILCGKEKGKEGKIIKTFKKENRVVVEGLNIFKKHMKPNGSDNKGGIIEKENPIHVSNVKVISSSKNEKTVKPVKKEETKTEKKPAAKKKTATKKVKES